MANIQCGNCIYWSKHLIVWDYCTQRAKDTLKTDSCIMWMEKDEAEEES